LAALLVIEPRPYGCGCSSGVEHNLAKVGVVGSNPIARSNRFSDIANSCMARVRLTPGSLNLAAVRARFGNGVTLVGL
jgi:hypothetical protein